MQENTQVSVPADAQIEVRSLCPQRFSPDGLTEQIIDVLLREVGGAAAVKPQPSPVLMDGQATLRWYRREARRCASAVVRALPVRGAAGGPDGRPRVIARVGCREIPDVTFGADARHVLGHLVPVTTWVHPDLLIPDQSPRAPARYGRWAPRSRHPLADQTRR
ncbi:MAG TPA: hypothetical protein VK784_01470, partial [Pseudonocardiaceae bacterium]|nr:hypothetical protein [Pseudonocardiaceae bacterium]